jgi:hypothetical protein
VVERLLELGRPRVRPHEHRDLLERNPALVQPPDMSSHVQARPDDRLVAVRERRSKRLRRAAEPRHEPIRELEHLRRRAIVPLEPHHIDVRKAPRQREQPRGARAREAVDRLVVVADRAELVPLAEPEVEQRLLEEVDVLVLVHGEGAPALVHHRPRLVVLEQPHRPLEHVLEVEHALSPLAALVLSEDPAHEVERQRRLVVAETVVVRLGREPPVLRPLDLRREIAGGAEAVRPRERVADPAQEERLRGEDPAGISQEVAEEGERRRVEGRGAHAVGAERV